MSEPRWRRYLRFWARDVRADVDDEIRFHFEQRVTQYRADGMSPGDAVVAARAQFGDVDAVRGELVGIDRRIGRRRDSRAWLDALGSDLKVTLRSLRRAPAFSAAVVVTLALGLGANAAMFSFLDRVYLRPPAGVRDPGSLRRFWLIEHDRKGELQAHTVRVTANQFRDLADAYRSDAELALFASQPNVRLGEGGDAPAIIITRAAANYLPLLGLRAAIGRLFTADEAATASPARVVVISELLWRTRFGGDPAVIGKQVKLSSVPFTIIGVVPPRFDGIELERTSAWIPLSDAPVGMRASVMYAAGNGPTFGVLARVRPGADDASLETRATTILRRASAATADADTTARVKTGSIIAARGPGKESKEIVIANRLGGVAVIVLLIACANVVNLLLARAVARRREIAVRVALGISRARLIWLLSAESTVLALAAGIAAVASAGVTGGLLRARLVPDIELAGDTLHWRVAVATLVGALVAGAIAGLVPAFQMSRPNITGFLKTGARDGAVPRSWLRPVLVAAQAALSVVLLVGAVLFVSSLRNVEGIKLGYDVPRIASAGVLFDDWRPHDSVKFARAAQRVRYVHGVHDLALTTYAPMNGGLLFTQFYTATDSAGDPHADEGAAASLVNVSASYFKVTGTRIVRGRDFAEDPGRSVVVNQTMARRYWPAGDAIGQCMRFTKRDNPCYTVVGIVEDAHRRTVIEKPNGQFYAPLAYPVSRGMQGYNMLIRAEPRDMAAVLAATRRILLEEFPGGRPMISRMEDTIAPAYRPFRLGALLFSVFGLLALVVASVGVYSTVAYTAMQRTHEFGVRVALGATLGQVVSIVVRGALTTVGVGVAIGAAVALAGGRLIASLLYGITPANPLVYVGAAFVLLAVAVVAALIPATRAGGIDPVIALRAE